MKRLILFGGLVIVICALVYYVYARSSVNKESNSITNLTTTMILSSPAFNNKAAIPAKYTCDESNTNPPLQIADVPESAKTLVLIVDDPDAPVGTWVHWLVWNISPQTQIIEENSAPINSVEGTTSFGAPGYGGPCPPSGNHRYFFKLYALDTNLSLNSSADKSALEKAMAGHIVAQSELMGRYSRQ